MTMTTKRTRPGFIVRNAVILLGGLVLLWLSLAITVANVFATRAPRTALAWWPVAGTAAAKVSSQLMESPEASANATEAFDLARTALRREPGNAVAARSIGLWFALNNRGADAERMFAYSERLSRRDVPTQLWLIETLVQRGDIAGALLHYDRAMRTSEDARGTLVPILVQASANPDVAAALADVLRRRPNWWGVFAKAVIEQGTDVAALARLVPALRLDPADPDQRTQLAAALRRMADLGGVMPAYATYLQARHLTRASAPPMRSGDFEDEGGLSPFEWQFANLAERQAVREPRDGAQGQFALSLYGNAAGEAARQMLVLPAGAYQLSARVGDVPGDAAARPILWVACTNAPGTPLARQSFPAAGGKIGFGFAIPAGCPSQWLFVSTGSSIDRPVNAPWIDSIVLARR